MSPKIFHKAKKKYRHNKVNVYACIQAVDLTKLNLMQLTQFKNGLDTDIQFYQESLQNLKHAQSK